MDSSGWLRKLWKKVEGHVYYEILKFLALTAISVISTYVVARARHSTREDWLGYLILAFMVFCALVLSNLYVTKGRQELDPPKSNEVPVSVPVNLSEAILSPRSVDLQGEFLEVFIQTFDEIAVTRTYVLIKVRIVNAGKDEVTIVEKKLDISLPNWRAVATSVDIPDHWRLKKPNPRVLLAISYVETEITPKLGANPLDEVYKKGLPKEGWLAFELYISRGETAFPNAQFDLLLTDSLGNQHRIRRNMGLYPTLGELIRATT